MVASMGRRALIAAVLLCAVTLAGCTGFGQDSDGEHDFAPISAKEAEAIASSVALAWRADAQLAMLGAVDGAGGAGMDAAGAGGFGGTAWPFGDGGPANLTFLDSEVDGRSVHWRAVYRTPGGGEALAINVVGNGTTWQQPLPDSGPPSSVGEWRIDSVEALALARSRAPFDEASRDGVALLLVGDMSGMLPGYNGPSGGEPEPLWYLMVEGTIPPVILAVKARSGELVDPLEMLQAIAGDYGEQAASEAGLNSTNPDAESDPGGEPAMFWLNDTYQPGEPWNSTSLVFEVGEGRTTIDVVFSWQAPSSVESAEYSLREARGTEPELVDHAASEQVSGGNRTVEVRDSYAVDARGTYHAALGEINLSDFDVQIEYQFVITVS